ncbi:MAG: 16S rRNA (cytidine(1402)-2'-O)-methyltransferase [Bacteriovoracaceae bacterium]
MSELRSRLLLVTTPIGNLGDITARAEKALREGKDFLCEDTRNTKSLFSLLGISLEGKNFYAYHDHSGDSATERILEELEKGKSFVLVSDAGSPMVSDPAYPLVKKAIELGIEVDSCPGASAVILALELSGLPSSPFTFHGFLGREKKDRKLFYQKISLEAGTHLFFEGASRVEETLEELSSAFPDFEMAVGRELTKKFQSIYRFKGNQFKDIQKDFMFKGEFVILLYVEKKKESSINEEEVKALAEDILKLGNKPKVVAKLLSSLLGKPTKEIYELLGKNERE